MKPNEYPNFYSIVSKLNIKSINVLRTANSAVFYKLIILHVGSNFEYGVMRYVILNGTRDSSIII